MIFSSRAVVVRSGRLSARLEYATADRVKMTFVRIATIFGALVVTACQSKGPTPKESGAASSAAPTAEHAREASAPAQDPHAGLHVDLQTPAAGTPKPEPDASGRIDLGAVTVQVPAGWQFEKPRALMRRAQFSVPGPGADASLVIFYMGQQGAGSLQSNLTRWSSQFTAPNGNAVPASVSERTVAGLKLTQLEVAGTYDGGMRPTGQRGEPSVDHRMITTVLETDRGPYYFRLVGPDATVAANRDAMNEMLDSATRSSGSTNP